MVLKLGSNAPSNAVEIYNKLKTLLDNKENFICLVFDTVTNIYLGDCEAVFENNGTILVQQYRPYFTTDLKVIYKYIYSFSADGTYKRSHGTYKIVTE